MKPFTKIKRQEIFNLGLFAVSLIPIVLYLFTVYQRITLPIDLEWGEGAGINQIYWLMSGSQLYSPPTKEFMPLVYPPFYYWLAAIMGRISGQAQLAARLLSFLASLGAAGLIAWVVIKETGEDLAGWLSGALYLACFALSDGFFDLVRVDSFYVFLMLLAFVLMRFITKPAGWVLGGMVIALGFFTKQSTLLVFAPLLFYLFYKVGKRTWPLILTVVFGVVIPFYWINTKSGGWFAYYIFELPQEHGYSLVSAVDFWVGDLLGPLGIAIGVGLFYLFTNLLKESTLGNESDQSDPKQQTITYMLFVLGSIGAAWITRASNGGGSNNVMSAYAAVALLFGLGYSAIGERIKRTQSDRELSNLLFFSIVAIQLIGLMYNPFNFIPSEYDRALNQALISEIAEVPGEIWIPYRSHLPRLAGKGTSIHAVNLFELTGYFKGDVLPEGRTIVDQIREDICRQSFGLIVLDQPIPWIEQQLAIAYQESNPFTDLPSSRRSLQLAWQGGYDATYIPLAGSDLESCLATNNQVGAK